MNKLIIGGIVIAVLSFFVWRIENLSSKNMELTKSLEIATETTERMREHAERIDQAQQRLEKLDNENTQRLKSFEKQLRKYRDENAELRSVLSIVIPDELVSGLRAFGHGNKD